MTVVGEYRDAEGRPRCSPPLVRYVECKCLLGGVTTSQGIMLAATPACSASTAASCATSSRPTTRTCPRPRDASPTWTPRTRGAFLARLKKEDSCFLLHLSEGVTDPAQPDSIARRHFLALQVAPDEWALNDRFAGIHAAGLLPEDFDVLAPTGASMVWSPLQQPAALRRHGARRRGEGGRRAIGLGSDWSPSGSKNLLGELKVAWLYSQHAARRPASARATSSRWPRATPRRSSSGKALGTLEPGKRADLLVIDGTAGDPYEALIQAKETDDPAGDDQRHRALRQRS